MYRTGIINRKEADDLFYQMMIADGFPKWKCYCCWLGVRIGGGMYFSA
nr:MAG TPA: Protein of unknown function (DUF1353) [Bacteriophage sp.]